MEEPEIVIFWPRLVATKAHSCLLCGRHW